MKSVASRTGYQPISVPCRVAVLVSQVSSAISDFTPCVHAQSDILYINYAEKADG